MATQDRYYRKVNTVDGRVSPGAHVLVGYKLSVVRVLRAFHVATANDIETSAEHTYGVQQGIAVLRVVRCVCR
jgi:hypothetical protein